MKEGFEESRLQRDVGCSSPLLHFHKYCIRMGERWERGGGEGEGTGISL